MTAESPTLEATIALQGVKRSNNKKMCDQTVARRPRTEKHRDQQPTRCMASVWGVTHLLWSCVKTEWGAPELPGEQETVAGNLPAAAAAA